MQRRHTGCSAGSGSATSPTCRRGQTPSQPSDRERLLQTVVNGLESHPALAVWKGVDEPRNPARGDAWIRPAGLVRGYERLKQLDPRHPLVVIQAPGSTAAQLTPYRPAFDLTGMDIYPVSYPPGVHGGATNKAVSVVGDWARVIGTAAGPKPFWMTLADRVDGRRPLAAETRRRPALSDLTAGTVHGAPGDRQRRPRARLLRRPPDPGVHAGRRQGGLELDVLGPHPPPARRRAVLRRRPPCPRRAESEGDRQGGDRRSRGHDAAGGTDALGAGSAPGRRHLHRRLHRPPEQARRAEAARAARSCPSGSRILPRLRSAPAGRCSAALPSRTVASATGSGLSTPGSTASASETHSGRGQVSGPAGSNTTSTMSVC